MTLLAGQVVHAALPKLDLNVLLGHAVVAAPAPHTHTPHARTTNGVRLRAFARPKQQRSRSDVRAHDAPSGPV